MRGLPLPLAWRHRMRFTVCIMDGREIEVRGVVSPPFAIYQGDQLRAGYERGGGARFPPLFRVLPRASRAPSRSLRDPARGCRTPPRGSR